MTSRAKVSLVGGDATNHLERLIDDYLTSCRAQGLSRGSLNAYEFPLRKVFLPWARQAGISSLDQLDRAALERYQATLFAGNPVTGKPLSKDSVHSYLRPLRQLIRYAAAEGEAVRATPKLPQLTRRVLDVLSLEEIDRLEGAAGNERDMLIIRLLADTGMRVGELVQLRRDDFRTKDRRHEILVRGKGDRDRLVAVLPGLFRRVEKYAERTRPRDTYSDRLFLGLRRSKLGVFEPLTTSGVEQLVRSGGDRAGIRDAATRCHPHMLRHSFVTNALRRGMNPMNVKQFVGHSSLRMIDQVYSHLTVTDQHEALMRMVAADRAQR
jgi:site-specific recombinase XerD